MSLRSTYIPQGRPRSESLPPAAQTLFEEIVRQLPEISTYTELVFENVKPDDGSLICRALDGHAETERRGARHDVRFVHYLAHICTNMMVGSIITR